MIVVEIPPITTEGTVVFLGELRLRRAFDPSEARIVRGRLIAEPGSLLPEKGEVSINVGDYAPLQTVGLEGDGFSISNVYPGTYGITVISRHYARSWASLTVSTQSPPSIEILHTMHPTRIIRGRLHTSTRVTREFRLESDGNHDLLFGLLPGERISFISFDSQLNLACPSGAVAVTAGEYEGMGSIEAMLLNSDVRVDWERPSWTGRLQPGDLVAVLQRGVEDGSGVGGPRRPLRIPAVIEVLAVEASPAASPTSDHARAEAGTSPRGDAGTPIRLTIDRAEMESWLRNLNVLAAQARIVPYLENGKPNGFKIFAIKPGSAFTRLGLEDNDVVLRIDGIPMSSPDNALTAYKRLNDGCLPGSAPACRLITLDLLREGRPLALEYHIP